MHKTSGRAVRRLLRERGQQAWVELALRYGKTFRHGPFAVTCEPAAVRALLMDRAHAEERPAAHRMMAKLPGANGILFMAGEKWRQRTRALMPVFHQRNVDSYSASLHETTLAHAAHWQQRGRAADLYDAVQQLGVASILRMGYGLDPDDPAAARLGRALIDYKQFTMQPQPRHRLDEFAVGPSKVLALPWLLAGLVQMRVKTTAVERALREVVARRLARGERPDWIRQLHDAGLGSRELAEEINHLYGAYNAIDYVVTAALYEIARDHRLAALLRAEIVAALGTREPAAREDLARLPLTNAFMLEVLRRYPVTMGVVRRLGKPMPLGGETLPSGTEVLILLHALHHHPEFWDDADQLKPERWLESPAPKVPFSYVPFLDGSRKCIGRAMAELHLLVIVTTIVRRFDLTVYADAVVPPFIIPRFANPIPYTLAVAAAIAA
jgi:cytochrome P450